MPGKHSSLLVSSALLIFLVLCLPISHFAEAASQAAENPESRTPGVTDFLLTGKYVAFLVLMLAGVVLLLGKWITIWLRIGVLLVAFVLFGLEFVFPLHPSPMCGVVKLFMFKITQGKFFPVFVAMFLAMLVPSLIGRKLFCGWVCPLGALQELVNKIPHGFHWKQFSFAAFNSIRMALLAMFLLTFFFVKNQIGFLGQRIGADISARYGRPFQLTASTIPSTSSSFSTGMSIQFSSS